MGLILLLTKFYITFLHYNFSFLVIHQNFPIFLIHKLIFGHARIFLLAILPMFRMVFTNSLHIHLSKSYSFPTAHANKKQKDLHS